MIKSTHLRDLSFVVVAVLALASTGVSQDASSDTVSPPSEETGKAQAIILGKGVGAKHNLTPYLLSEAPVLGSEPMMRLKGLTPRSRGVIFIGAPAANPLALTDTVSLWLDLDRSKYWAAVPYDISAEGGFNLPLVVPSDPDLAGVPLVFQAFASVDGKPEITNGMLWVLGN